MAKRITKELSKLLEALPTGVTKLAEDEADSSQWVAIIEPTSKPFNVAAFELRVSFPEKYPFEAPTLTFATPILHPNVDDEGGICLNIVDPAKWKPATKMSMVFEGLLSLIHEPEIDHPLRADLAELFDADRATWEKRAAEHAAKHGLKR
eukprot:CAMPEP_0182924978 /NCGR_PEP_ID=MMETSP0105_2-20130417/8062_1 /TAXON_ID=81532 ORGANISM="Acanthoeca-like sp., Strain 10tr" /NCGR_SAMPLE_ID=MMETSP0105_2 /ASSEMBLY_ACC=CAM_ASM_000205 /LENGTH=149 /DNA_ID=CAMNT_0025062805 /DNA_START=23 /DNA_END=472 /DNA_ORIENTATION=+